MPGSTQFRHRPALDALRGLAVLVVVAFHSELGLAKGGYLGVSTFFTLSGFLITTLVLVEHRRTGRFDLSAFWRRRFRRLLPAAVATVALVVVLVAVLGVAFAQGTVGSDAASSIFYVANWHLLWSGTSYAQLFTDPSPLVHMWSLAVEEQFYLLFPLIVVLLVGRSRGADRAPARLSLRARIGVVAGLTVVVSAALPVVLGFGVDRTYYGTDTRAAEIALGVLLAVLAFPTATSTEHAEALGRAPARLLVVASTVALVAMAGAWAVVPETSPVWRHGGFVLYGLGSVALVAAAVYAVGPVGRIGALRPLCRLGLISYGVYLVHWPVLWVIDLETSWPSLLRFVVALGVSVGVAELSMRGFETPIRRTGRVGGVSAMTVVPAVAAVAILGAAVVAGSAPPPIIDYASAAAIVDSVPSPAPDTPVPVVDPPATVESAGASTEERVAFFGDSTALMTASGFRVAAADDPRLDGVPGRTILGCGILLADGIRGVGGQVGTIADKCVHQFDEWAAKIDGNRPDVAVVQAGPWETWDLRWSDVEGWHHLGDPIADERALAQLRQVVQLLSVDGARVAFVTTSPVDRRKPGPGPCACPERLDRWNELLRQVAAEEPDTVSIIDLDGWLRSIGPDEDARLRLDGVHFSEVTAAEVSRRWLIDQVLAVPRNPVAAGPPATTLG